MKTLDSKRERRPTNCTGPEEVFDVSSALIEETDIGRTRDNFLGFRHRSYKFSHSDVGRKIEIVSQPTGYTCWYFDQRG